MYINPRYINSAYQINKNNVEYMKVLVGNTHHIMVLSEYHKLIAEAIMNKIQGDNEHDN